MPKAVKWALLTVVIFVVIFAASIYLLTLPRPMKEQMIEEYARTYLQEYKNLVEVYGSGLGNTSQFKFYSGYPYHVIGVVSETHGGAVFFTSSSSQTIETKTIPERIEFYLWPVMKQYSSDAFWERKYPQESGFESYIISANLQIGDGETVTYAYCGKNTLAIFLDAGYPKYDGYYRIRVMLLGRLRIDGMLIYENRMILKGSNEERDWLPEIAVIDATNEFLRIAKDLVLTEAEVKEIQGLALLRAKAEQIGRNLATGVYQNNPTLQSHDEQEFWREAEEYGIKPGAAQKIKELAEERYKAKPWFQPLVDLLPAAVIDALVALGITAIVAAVYRRIRKRPRMKTRETSPKYKRKGKYFRKRR